MNDAQTRLQDWHAQALRLEQEVAQAVIGQDDVIRLLCIAVLARGHVLLEGDVGVGKTTLLRAVARAVGGRYERVEGTVDLMPSDLVYYTYVSEEGKPRVDRGPLLKHGEDLSVFFFNEINRARPQVHSLMLRVMAEGSVTAFNREFAVPHVQVFADRNRVERDETYEIPPAARDRFLMELTVEMPADETVREALMLDPRFHDVDTLIEGVAEGVFEFRQLAGVASRIQTHVQASKAIARYVLELCRATGEPTAYDIAIDGTEPERLVRCGVSPRGMSMIVRAAKVAAWLDGRSALLPEDIHLVFRHTAAHRVFLAPVYEMRRADIMGELVSQILARVAVP